ncbi:MAG: DUF5686 family protein [Bacteroidota bacterium]
MKYFSSLSFSYYHFISLISPIKVNSIFLFISLLLLATAKVGYAQQATPGTVSGMVTDGTTGEAIPFANVYFQRSPQLATQTSLEGKFTVRRSKLPNDSLLIVSFIGYQSDTITVSTGHDKPLIIKLQSTNTKLKEVVISSGENPAYAIIRRAVANKDRNNPHSLDAYQMESYNRVEVYLNRTEGIKNAKVVKEIKTLMERQPGTNYRDAKGNILIPLTVTESISNNYFLQTPPSNKEEILHTHTTGIGLEEDDAITKLLSGNGFRDYNFYKNRVQILDKWMASPIADGWKFNYEYFLEDSIQLNKEWYYRISVDPRRETDVAFIGTIWVSKQDYGLKKIDLRISPNANINFVETLRIRQETDRDSSGAWFATSQDYEIGLVEASKRFPGLQVKVHTTNQKIVVNQPKPLAFFLESRNYSSSTSVEDENYWLNYRETASDTTTHSQETFALIDSIKQLPIASKYAFWGRTLTTGYVTAGKVDIGHWLYSYAWNNVEGNRFSLGLRTNLDFSKNLFLEGWAAYGGYDKRFKYNLAASYVLSRKNFTTIGIRQRDDTEPIGQLSIGYNASPVLKAFNRWFNLKARNPYAYTESALWIENEIRPGLGTKFTARHLEMQELFPKRMTTEDTGFTPKSFINSSELEVTIRFNPKERSFRTRFNQLKVVGPQPAPTFTVTGIFGLNHILGSTFNYQKLVLNITQKQLSVFGFGTAEYSLQAGYVFSALPYALLKVHQGNNTALYYRNASQNMGLFEFVSDHFIEFHYTHYFNNLILSQIPGIRQLNKTLDWRLLATTNIVWGGIRPENIAYNERTNRHGKTILPFQTLSNVPYVEVGYGVENIFHALRIDFIHRLTYLKNPGISRFGIKISANIKL